MAIPLAKHLPELDGLRAFACFAVIFFHYPFRHNFLQTYGWAGVDLFFVISGFLITGILIRTRERSGYFQNFYLRRVLRIWPLYYFVITFIFMVFWLKIYSAPPPQAPYWIFATHLQNILGHLSGPPRSLLVTWSLGVEEQFYLLWPLICWKAPRRVLPWICGGLLILAPIARILAIHAGWDASRIRYFPLCCVDGLAAGSLLALWISTPNANPTTLRRVSLITFLFGTLMFAVLATHPELTLGWVFSYSFLAIGFGGLVALSLWFGSPLTAFIPLQYLGRISYGLYLFHSLMLAVTIKVVHWQLGRPYIALILTVAVSSMSFHFFETPIAKLKNRISYAP